MPLLVSAASEPAQRTFFFAYIGFDAVQTTAQEARNPKRDVPIGIIVSLVLCTILYIAVTAVLTGMVYYRDINIDAPLADAFTRYGLVKVSFFISVGAVAGLTSVLLVLLLGQSQDIMGHSQRRSPSRATLCSRSSPFWDTSYLDYHCWRLCFYYCQLLSNRRNCKIWSTSVRSSPFVLLLPQSSSCASKTHIIRVHLNAPLCR